MKGQDLDDFTREDRIWTLRIAGLPLREIGERVGLSHVRVKQILDERLSTMVTPKVEEFRTIMHERLEKAIQGLMPKVEAGELGAVQALVKVVERQARLWGLDRPAELSIEWLTGDKPWNHIYDAILVRADESAADGNRGPGGTAENSRSALPSRNSGADVSRRDWSDPGNWQP